MIHWSTKYIGRKWREDYDCYQFFIEVQRAIFGITNQLDFIAPDYRTRGQALEFVRNSEDVKRHWRRVDNPNEGDAVLFGNVHNSFHIGIWIVSNNESGILHCQKGHGVVFTSRRSIMESAIMIARYLRCNK